MAKGKKSREQNLINIKQSLVDGHVGATKFINNDWKTVAFSFSREYIKTKFLDKELRYNGIYFLFGYEEGHEVVYVGQALKRANGESLLARLREHADSKTESYRDKWTWVVAITNEGDTWGATEVDALESIFINEVPTKNNLNGRSQNNAGADISAYSDKVNQIKSYITAIGFKIFDDITEKENINIIDETNISRPVEDLQNGTARIPEIVTPTKVVKAMVDLLPEEVWNSETRFLDLACKGGEYLREVYDRLMETEIIQAKFPDAIERSNHILLNQIYGIALSPVSVERTKKKLLGCGANIRIISNYTNKMRGLNLGSKSDGKQKNIKDIIEEEFGADMKFDVVIGNPPYQESTGSGLNESGGKALFDKFISKGVDISNRIVCMITPTKWIAGNQSDFVNLRAKLLEGNHMVKMVDYMNAKDIFPGRSIAGGVSYFLYDKKRTAQTEFTTVLGDAYTHERELNRDGIIPRHAVGESVINKIKQVDKNFLASHIYKNKWNLPTDYCEGSIVPQSADDIKVITPQGEYYAKSSEFDMMETGHYKVMFTRVITEHAVEPGKNNTYKILSSIRVIEPNEICNASYMVVDGISKKEYAGNIKTYLETKFVRFLILQTLFGIGLTADRFQFVPVQDFSKSWSDNMLYEKYDLTKEEIGFIENVITPINSKVTDNKLVLTRQEIEAAMVNKIIQNN